ncbi:hypothetical protein DV738_g2142, partial [Chaetothyriales sp. CBS 135597]
MTAPIPDHFRSKKQKILAALAVPESEYSDNSPKGSVDEPIRELIDFINSHPGWCTTSSCSGRVAVFVEGPKGSTSSAGFEVDNGDNDDNDSEVEAKTGTKKTPTAKKVTKTGPGGKGGGHWLFVSHSALTDTANIDQLNIIAPESSSSTTATLGGVEAAAVATTTPRLVHLSFSPLILHVLCASLDHARPLLAAAINAGFRESGVPSLKVLEEPEKGVMVAIRTAGLAFSTVVGDVTLGQEESKSRRVVVSEDYLRMCLGVVDERFKANEERKKRLEEEIRRIIGNKEEQKKQSKEAGRGQKNGVPRAEAPTEEAPGEETAESLFEFDLR